MPSRADTRRTVELVLRAAGLAIMGVMLWQLLTRPGAPPPVSAGSSGLAAALREWSTRPAPPLIGVRFTEAPAPEQRDWLAALVAAGSQVRWTGDLPAIGIGAQAIASPRGGFAVLVGTAAGSPVVLSDELGVLDTAAARRGGARFVLPAASGELTARAGRIVARTSPRDSVQVRRILVIGRAGWESKFVIAALEEDGWTVDAEIDVAPGVKVTQGTRSPIDTARYSAVVALDGSAAIHAARIVSYVNDGGGLVLAGSAGAVPSFSPVRPAGLGTAASSVQRYDESEVVSLGSLPLSPLVALRNDAVVLGRIRVGVSVAARRQGTGRVLQHGFGETWRWRMRGGDYAVEEHRQWWTSAVSAVAYAPRIVRVTPQETENAPLSRLVETLGQKSSGTPVSLAAQTRSISLSWLFALLAFCLLAEWASRRLRGSR